MRDPIRIDPILAKLRAYWTAHPDMRLGQIVNGDGISVAARGKEQG